MARCSFLDSYRMTRDLLKWLDLLRAENLTYADLKRGRSPALYVQYTNGLRRRLLPMEPHIDRLSKKRLQLSDYPCYAGIRAAGLMHPIHLVRSFTYMGRKMDTEDWNFD